MNDEGVDVELLVFQSITSMMLMVPLLCIFQRHSWSSKWSRNIINISTFF